MIEFARQDTDTPNESSLHAWAEVMNWHIDKVHVRNIFKEVILYESFKYPKEGPVCAGFVIWDDKKKSVWLITDSTGNLDLKSEAYKKLKMYATDQTAKLLAKR